MTVPPGGLRTDDMFRLRWVDAPRLAPDGRRVAYLQWRLDDESDQLISRVGLQDLDGGASWFIEEPGCAIRSVRWSPDGRRLLAVVSTNPAAPGSGTSAATGVRIYGSETGRLLSHPIVDQAADAEWSPDGMRVAATIVGSAGSGRGFGDSAAPGQLRFDIGRMVIRLRDCAGGHFVDLVDDSAQLWAPQWSPDGRFLAHLARGASGAELWVRPPNGGGPIRRFGGGFDVKAFVWSPDDHRIAYVGGWRGQPDRDQRLWVVDVERGTEVELTRGFAGSVGTTVRGDDHRGTLGPALAWSGHTGRIYVELAVGGQGTIGWFRVDGGHGRLSDRPGAWLSPSVASRRPLVAAVLGSATDPGEVMVLDEMGAASSRITDSNQWLAGRLGEPITVAARRAGASVQGWLTVPPGRQRRRSLVVSIHGGPHYSIGDRFTFEVHRLTGLGVAVLTLNPRGSQGYGEEFATALRADWGGADAADVHALVDVVAAGAAVDPRRMVVTGVSYGGFLTQWLLCGNDRFVLGISENGISDFTSLWHSSAGWLSTAMGGPPSRSPRYRERSPLTRADQIRSPLVLLHAEDDQTCPIAQSEQMFASLVALGHECRLHRIAGEGHLMNLVGRPSNRLTRARVVDAAIGRYCRAR